jgi:1,4-dihydroxy-2-naphthoyl-CoA hydrolase
MKESKMQFEYTPEAMNKLSAGTLMERLQIKFTDYSNECLTAEMPVNQYTIQPYGTLHGGATVALAESVGSALSLLSVNPVESIAVGVEVNANHLRPVKSGKITAVATFIHKGNSIHVVDIRISDDMGQLIAVCRITNKILKKEEW